MKVGIIGLGNMGKNHVRNYHELDTCVLSAVCDIDPNLTESFSKKYKCQAFNSIEDLINSKTCEAVSITSPTSTHYNLAKKCLENNIHVLVEKPITNNLKEAQELIDLAKKNNKTLMVGHIERYNPAVITAKQVIENGDIGKPTCLIAKRVGAFPAQIKDMNVIIDLAVHDIDIFSYLLNKYPTNIMSNAGKALHNKREDYAEIFLNYDDQNGFIQVNWITPIRIRNLAITGTKGYMEINYMTQEINMHESNYATDFDNFGEYIIKFGETTRRTIAVEKAEPLKKELGHFLTCCQTGQTPITDGSCGIRALETALTVLHQINQAKTKQTTPSIS